MQKLRKVLTLLVVLAAVTALVLPIRAGSGRQAPLLFGVVALVLLAARIGFTVVDVKRGASPPLRLALPLVILVQGLVTVMGESCLKGPVGLAAAAVELAVLVTVVITLWRGRRGAGLLEDRITAGLTALLPARIARLVAMEVVILGAVLGAPLRLHRQRRAGLTFSYHETTRLRLLLVAGPLLLLFEGIVINQLLAPDHFWLRTLHVAVCLYATLWIWGAYSVMKLRPHRIDGDDLWVHRGVWGHFHVPVGEVIGVRAVIEAPLATAPGDDARALTFTVKGTERVELTLRSPIAPMGFLTPLKPADRIVVSADDAAAFCDAVSRAAGVVMVRRPA
jgi:hypothetical protein